MGRLKASHVYMSFREDEEDEGACRFIRSLSTALEAQGLTIFRRHPNLPYHLLNEAMNKSWVWIVVFSNNYASSSLCLKELAHFAGCGYSFRVPHRAVRYYRGERVMGEMMEADIEKVNNWMRAMNEGPHCEERSEEKGSMIGVYYDVDPQSIVQHIQRHAFLPPPPPATPHLSIMMQEYLEDKADEQRRRKAAVLQLITSLPDPDCHLPNNSIGSQAIPKIVKQVKTKIDQHFYKLFGFVGIQSQVEEAEKLLELSRDDEVRVVGICGMSGLGKSSIATVLYLKIFHYFDAFCFLPNVSARLKHGDISLHELLHRHLRTENEAARRFLDKEFLACKRLINHKFLIVLDGVNLAQHLQELNLDKISYCFGAGSRIIITTRDEQILREYDIGSVYRPKLLSKEEASELFCSKAFPMEYPTEEFKEMMERAVEYANGLPLAIVTLGSYLYGKSVAEWRSYLLREEIIPPFEIIMVLRKCFDELDGMSKDMLLDIACFFVGKDINCVKEILQDCFSCDVDIKIKLLIQKSILQVVNETIHMHGMLQAMGREIVRELCPNQPDKLSRLYLFRDIKYAMEIESHTGMENNVEAIALDLEEPNTTPLSIDALYLYNLRLLIFRNVKVSGNLYNLPRKLRYVLWHQYPFTALPSRFESDTLVQLIMPESNMTEVWEGKMRLPMLKKMNLCGSKTLTKTPDFGECPNLEKLELEGCIGLLLVDASVAELSNLKILNLRGCINLHSIPNSLFSVNSLEILNLAGCSKFAYCLDFSLNEELDTSQIIARHLEKEAIAGQKDTKNNGPHKISKRKRQEEQTYSDSNVPVNHKGRRQGRNSSAMVTRKEMKSMLATLRQEARTEAETSLDMRLESKFKNIKEEVISMISTRQESNAPQTHLHVGQQSNNDGPAVHSPRPTVHHTQIQDDQAREVVDEPQPQPQPQSQPQLSAMQKVILMAYDGSFKSRTWPMDPKIVGKTGVPVNIKKEDLTQLVTHNQLTVACIQVFMMYMHHLLVSSSKDNKFGFLCPIHTQENRSTPALRQEYLFQRLREGKKECFLLPYVNEDHWQLVLLSMKSDTVVFLCSLQHNVGNELKKIIDLAMRNYQQTILGKLADEVKGPTWIVPKSRKQPNNTSLCGFYVLRHIFNIITLGVTEFTQEMYDIEDPFSQEEIDDIRQRWADYFVELI